MRYKTLISYIPKHNRICYAPLSLSSSLIFLKELQSMLLVSYKDPVNMEELKEPLILYTPKHKKICYVHFSLPLSLSLKGSNKHGRGTTL